MARDKVFYDGHAVAAVAATSASVARKALKLIKVDYQVLPHVTDVDEAMKPGAPLLHDDMITGGVDPAPKKASNVAYRHEFGHGDVEAGLQAGRRRRQPQLQDRGHASGLYRAARLPRQCRPGRPGRALGLHPGPLHDPQRLRGPARHGRRQAARHAVGDRRRLRRQDHRVHRAGRPGAVAQGQPSGEDGDEPRGGVPRHRPHRRQQHGHQDRRQEGRPHHRRPGRHPLHRRPIRRLRSSIWAPCRPLPPTTSRTARPSATTSSPTGRSSPPTAPRARPWWPSASRACSTSSPRRSAWIRSICA